jgi:hypothetical protein
VVVGCQGFDVWPPLQPRTQCKDCKVFSQTEEVYVKTKLRTVRDEKRNVTYQSLMFVCPGCVAGATSSGYEGIHDLPVNVPSDLNIGKPSWTFDGNTDCPTLSPSILTHESKVHARCHSFLEQGVFRFLDDCTHPLVGQHVPMPDLPTWAEELS